MNPISKRLFAWFFCDITVFFHIHYTLLVPEVMAMFPHGHQLFECSAGCLPHGLLIFCVAFSAQKAAHKATQKIELEILVGSIRMG